MYQLVSRGSSVRKLNQMRSQTSLHSPAPGQELPVDAWIAPDAIGTPMILWWPHAIERRAWRHERHEGRRVLWLRYGHVLLPASADKWASTDGGRFRSETRAIIVRAPRQEGYRPQVLGRIIRSSWEQSTSMLSSRDRSTLRHRAASDRNRRSRVEHSDEDPRRRRSCADPRSPARPLQGTEARGPRCWRRRTRRGRCRCSPTSLTLP